MAKADQGTVRIKWVRSGIAFNRKQAEVVRSLGLRRLHHVVERQDTPVVRGLIAKVPHLVEVIGVTRAPAWAAVPEYTIIGAMPATETPAVAAHTGSTADAPALQGSEPEVPADVAAVEPEAEGADAEAKD